MSQEDSKDTSKLDAHDCERRDSISTRKESDTSSNTRPDHRGNPGPISQHDLEATEDGPEEEETLPSTASLPNSGPLPPDVNPWRMSRPVGVSQHIASRMTGVGSGSFNANAGELRSFSPFVSTGGAVNHTASSFPASVLFGGGGGVGLGGGSPSMSVYSQSMQQSGGGNIRGYAGPRGGMKTPVQGYTGADQRYGDMSQSVRTTDMSDRFVDVTYSSASDVHNLSTSSMGLQGYKPTRGEPVVVGVNTYVDESKTSVISERYTETDVKVPKRVTREDVIEKVFIVPETVITEEVKEECVMVKQKVVHVAKVVVQEKTYEVPEIVVVEKIVEVPEIQRREKVKEVPRLEIQERIVHVPKIVYKERIEEVPQIEYVDMPYESIVEVPEVHEEVVLKKVPVPQYIDKPVAEYVDVMEETEIVRNVPVPVEAVTKIELTLPKIRPHYSKVDVPLYVPRFIEVPIPMEVLDSQALAQVNHYAERVAALEQNKATSLCEIERLGGALREVDFSKLLRDGGSRPEQSLNQAWKEGRFTAVTDGGGLALSASAASRISRAIGATTGYVYNQDHLASSSSMSSGNILSQIAAAVPMSMSQTSQSITTTSVEHLAGDSDGIFREVGGSYTFSSRQVVDRVDTQKEDEDAIEIRRGETEESSEEERGRVNTERETVKEGEEKQREEDAS